MQSPPMSETVQYTINQVASAMSIPQSMLVGQLNNNRILDEMTNTLLENARRSMVESIEREMIVAGHPAGSSFFPGATHQISDSVNYETGELTRTVVLTPTVPYINIRLNIDSYGNCYIPNNGPVIYNGTIHPCELIKLCRLLQRFTIKTKESKNEQTTFQSS